jgi:tripeptide aminopeptidase
MEKILDRLPDFVEKVREIREIIISNIVLIGQIPAPTFKEHRRAECLVERMANFQVDDCAIDDFGNPVAVIRGRASSRTAIFIVAHLDTFSDVDTDTLYTVTDKTISGKGVSDNSAAVGVMASLPEIIRHMGLIFESDIVMVAPIHSLGPGNLKGIRHLLEAWPTPIRGAICLESVELGRLNYYSDGMIRGEISCSIPFEKKMGRHHQPNAILIIHDVINAILKLRLPQKPRTQIVIGKIAGGVNHGQEAYDASIGFEIRSDSDQMVRELYGDIKDIVNGVNQTYAVELKLSRISHLNSTQLAYNHPLVKCAARLLYRLGEEAVSEPSETALSIFLQKQIPAITLGLTRGSHFHQEGSVVEIDPLFKGIAQIPALLMAMDNGMCNHE